MAKFFTSLFRPAHQKVVQIFVPFSKINLGIYGLWLGGHLLTQMLNQIAVAEGNQGPNIPLILVTVCTELTVSFFIYLIIPLRTKEFLNRQNPSSFKKIWLTYAKDLVSEQLRVASGIVIGLVMGIFPGLLRMVRWAFVPFIVTTNPAYTQGEVDALKYSEKLTKGLIGSIALFWLVLALSDLVFYYLEQINYLGQTDIAVWTWQGGVSLLSFIVQLYAVLLTYVIYDMLRSSEGVPR